MSYRFKKYHHLPAEAKKMCPHDGYKKHHMIFKFKEESLEF